MISYLPRSLSRIFMKDKQKHFVHFDIGLTFDQGKVITLPFVGKTAFAAKACVRLTNFRSTRQAFILYGSQ